MWEKEEEEEEDGKKRILVRVDVLATSDLIINLVNQSNWGENIN